MLTGADDHTPFEPNASPPGRRAKWKLSRLQRATVAGGLFVGLALGGYGIAYAASSSTSPSTTTPSNGHSSRERGGMGLGGVRGLRMLGGVVHGQFTVRTPSGTYKTVEVQTGTASSVSTSSITVKSPDGYTHTYAVTSQTVVDAERDGISSIANGDQVRVLAETVSGKDTTTSITDMTKIGSSRAGFGFARHHGAGTSGAWGANGPSSPEA